MSTRCLIGYKNEDNTVTYSYCHWDGYPNGVGKTLIDYYNEPLLARQIASLHGFSSLEKTYEETKKSEYEANENYYGKMSYNEYSTTDAFGVDYVYIYMYNCWIVRPTFGYGLNDLKEANLLGVF